MSKTATKLVPLGDNIIVRPDSTEEITASGIVIPDTASKEKPQRGEVIAVGPGKMDKDNKRVAMEVKKGQVVLFKKYGPDEIKIDGKEYLIAREEDILAIID